MHKLSPRSRLLRPEIIRSNLSNTRGPISWTELRLHYALVARDVSQIYKLQTAPSNFFKLSPQLIPTRSAYTGRTIYQHIRLSTSILNSTTLDEHSDPLYPNSLHTGTSLTTTDFQDRVWSSSRQVEPAESYSRYVLLSMGTDSTETTEYSPWPRVSLGPIDRIHGNHHRFTRGGLSIVTVWILRGWV